MSRLIRLCSVQVINNEVYRPGDWVDVGSQFAEHLLALGLADEGPGMPVKLAGDVGVVYVVYGDRAVKAARASVRSVKQLHPDLPVVVISDSDPGIAGVSVIGYDDPGPGARRAKLAVAELTPFEHSLYLDADTVVVSSLAPGFFLLGAFDMALAVDVREVATGGVLRPDSPYQEEERRVTWGVLPTPLVTQYACGMIFFRRCREVERLFGVWREEWERWQGNDQAAFLRALYRTPTRHIALPVEWNVLGQRREALVVHHRWGQARGKG